MRRTRKVMWCAFGAAVFATGLSAGIGTAGSTERAAAGATRLTAGLDARQEVPGPKGTTAATRGSFTATLERKGRAGTLTWQPDVSSADREGDCRPRSPCQAGSTGTGGARTLWPLSKRRARIGEREGRSRTGAVDRRCVRERAHRAESGRRDTRPDPGRLDGSPALDDDDHDDDEQHRRGSVSVGIRSSDPQLAPSQPTRLRLEGTPKRRSCERLRLGGRVESVGVREEAVHHALEAHELRRHACPAEPLGIALALVSKRVEPAVITSAAGSPERSRARRGEASGLSPSSGSAR